MSVANPPEGTKERLISASVEAMRMPRLPPLAMPAWPSTRTTSYAASGRVAAKCARKSSTERAKLSTVVVE
ncbi:hypothetical protein [Microbacterium aurantiacum]|uniref:hypothetical protein n=1 Tax=Microbacterium aurantiacum TaxID=162393 RepID=UPI0034196FCF